MSRYKEQINVGNHNLLTIIVVKCIRGFIKISYFKSLQKMVNIHENQHWGTWSNNHTKYKAIHFISLSG